MLLILLILTIIILYTPPTTTTTYHFTTTAPVGRWGVGGGGYPGLRACECARARARRACVRACVCAFRCASCPPARSPRPPHPVPPPPPGCVGSTCCCGPSGPGRSWGCTRSTRGWTPGWRGRGSTPSSASPRRAPRSDSQPTVITIMITIRIRIMIMIKTIITSPDSALGGRGGRWDVCVGGVDTVLRIAASRRC